MWQIVKQSLWLIFGFCLLSNLPSLGQRIFGAQLDRRILSNDRYAYGLTATYFTDQASVSAFPDRLSLRLYRKIDNKLIQEFTASKQTLNRAYTAFNCNKELRTDYVSVVYSRDLTLDPAEYSDFDGYYIVSQPLGTRNASQNVASGPVVLYHWFSPAYLFDSPDGINARSVVQWADDCYNYFCNDLSNNFALGINFVPQLQFRSSGSVEIKYRLVAPFTSYPGGPLPYRDITWKSNFSVSNQMPGGGPAVPESAPNVYGTRTNVLISATPTQTGVFTIGFVAEFFLNNRKLNEVYREYQIENIDCYFVKPATVSISEVGKPNVPAEARFCEGKSVQLNAQTNQSDVLYQWLRDGKPLAGSTTVTLVVREKGSYQVVVSKRGTCEPIASDPLAIEVLPPPTATIATAAPGTVLCPNATIQLKASPLASGYKYQWFRNDIALDNSSEPTYEAKQAGRYTVRVTAASQCADTSDATTLTAANAAETRIEAVPVQCLNTALPYPLKATPAGGTFAGPGVRNDTLYAKLAGSGTHELTYTVSSGTGCPKNTAKQSVVVVEVPLVDLGKDKQLFVNQSVVLNGNQIINDNIIYQWSPPTGLDNATIKNPTATPETTTTYKLKLSTPSGCTSEGSVTVFVLKPIYVPDAFTPDGDGINDRWKLEGLENYPEAETTVFNRWGQVVYHATGLNQTPFDGTYSGLLLPTGIYLFKIQTQPNGHVMRGKLLILR